MILFYFIFIFFLLKKSIFFLMISVFLCYRLECSFLQLWKTKHGDGWVTLVGVHSNLWVTDVQRNFGPMLVIILLPNGRWIVFIFLYLVFLQMAWHRRYFLIVSEKLPFWQELLQINNSFIGIAQHLGFQLWEMPLAYLHYLISDLWSSAQILALFAYNHRFCIEYRDACNLFYKRKPSN